MSKLMNPGNGLSWEPLEPLFQMLLPILFGERRPECEQENHALLEIHSALVTAAARIFRFRGFKGVDCDAEEAAQAWFVRVKEAGDKYDRTRPFHKYAYPILKSLCFDLGRRARLRNGRALSPFFFSAAQTAAALAIRREEQRRLRLALCALKRNGALTREQHLAIVYRHYWGLSAAEAGARCGVSAAKIHTLAHEARKILRNHLRKSA